MAREFDWSVLERPDAMAMVLGQLGFSWMELSGRLEALTDDDFSWEPAPGALSVVRRDQVRPGRRAEGVGDWVVEWPAERTAAELGEPGATTRTIAWLVAHLTEVFAERWDWTFGEHRVRQENLRYEAQRVEAVAGLSRWVEAWQEGIEGLDPARVFEVGVSTATEIDAVAPFGHLVLHVNRELIHHGAEICTLQDLRRAATAT